MLRNALGCGVTIAALLALPRSASADVREQCVAASEKAQQLRMAGKLSDARDQLAICNRTECPKLVAQDCAQWMSEVLAVLPSVVPAAKDERGRDLVDVKVSIDGKIVTASLDGKPIAVDPGVHAFAFEASGARRVEEKIVVRQGEKNRIVGVTLARIDDARPAPVTPAASSPPTAAFVVGGVGLAALGTALFVTLDADADARRLRDECAPRCNPADVDDIEQRRVVAGVTAAAGGALVVAGVVLLLVHGSGSTSKASVAFTPLPGGASGAAVVRF